MKNHLLTIGISQYPHWGDLNNASNDARLLSNLLLDNFQFEKEDYQELFDEDATNASIMYHFENYLYNLTSQDNLIIIFCGHGYYDGELDEGYWIPHEGRKGNRVSMIPMSTIEKFISAIKAHHILVIADSCFSGSLFRGDFEKHTESPHEKLYKIPSRWALTSGRLETVSDGPKGKQSPFMKSIYSSLNLENGELLSISELSNRVLSEVGSIKEQTPRGEPLKMLDHKGGQFIFYPKGYKIILKQKTELEKKEIPSHLMETFKLYVSHLGNMKKFASQQEYNEAAEVRDLKDNALNQLFNEIDKSLEEFKFDNSENINKLINTASIDHLRKEHKEIKNKKNDFIRAQRYEEAANARDEERRLIEGNQAVILKVVNEFKNKCAELINDNIYILYSFINQFIDELPFLHSQKHRDEIQKLLRRKFVFEITIKVEKLSELDIQINNNLLNGNLLKAIKELN